MNSRWLGIFFTIVLTVPAFAQKPKNVPAPKNSVAKVPKEKGGGLTKAERQQRLVERFNQMTPAQQEKVLANMTPERRQQVEKNLEQYRRLSTEQKSKMVDKLDHMPPDQQKAARANFRKLNQLPEDRRVPVRTEINRLNRMTEENRSARLDSPAFKKAYSPEEQHLITEMTRIFADN